MTLGAFARAVRRIADGASAFTIEYVADSHADPAGKTQELNEALRRAVNNWSRDQAVAVHIT